MTSDRRPRLLLLTTSTGTAGAERIVDALARRLPRDDWELEVAYLTGAATTLDIGLERLGIPVTRLCGVRHRPFALTRRLRALIERRGPTLVHSHLHHANVLACKALQSRPEVALVQTVHVIERRRRPLRPLLERRAAQRAQRVVAVSSAVAADVAARFGASLADRVVTVRNGIELAALEAVASVAWDAAPVIGAIGRLDHQKGFDLLLHSFVEVLRSCPEAELRIAGAGPAANGLRRLAQRLGVAGRVRWLGFQEDVAAVLASAAVVAFPSRWEGFGLVAAEAAAAARPVVAFDLPPTREVVVDGETGLVVPAGDTGAMAAGLVRLLADRELAARLGAAARDRARREFDVARMVEQYVGLYRQVLAR